MRNLDSYVLEQRGKATVDNIDNVDTDKVVGKPAEKNGTGGKWAVDEPYEDGAVPELDKATLSKNQKRLIMRMKAKKPFFILGEAGWGKTSIIKDIARRHKRHIITVYLDKCLPEDLGGIPVPQHGHGGTVKQELAMPGWAAVMLENPDKQYLLFFDEMNQADPVVQNALMPIVLENEICGIKFKNFIVGAAGNYQSENKAVEDLSGPLESRFKPIIIWSTNSDEDWAAAFRHMHKKWDDKVDPKLIDIIYAHKDLFVNPREIDQKIIEFFYELHQDGELDMFDASDVLTEIEGLTKEDLHPGDETRLNKLANTIYKFINNDETWDETRKSSNSKKGSSMIDPEVMKIIRNGMKNGYINAPQNGEEKGPKVKFGISEENLWDVVQGADDDVVMNRELYERTIAKLESEGIEFKFKKDAEWKKLGYVDPLED